MVQFPNPEEKEEKLEFLQREEIRTMQKDIVKLREIEAQKERERIASLTPKEKIVPPPEKPAFVPSEVKIPEPKKEEVPHLLPQEKAPPLPPKEESPKVEEETLVTFIPKPPKKLSPFRKILIRGVFLLILFFVLTFFYWFFYIKGGKSFSKKQVEEEKETGETQEIIIPSPSLITQSSTETLEIKNAEELAQSLSQILSRSFNDKEFTRLLIKDSVQNKFWGLKEFFEQFEIKTPENFYDKLNNDFTLFVYSDKGVNRLGFVAEIKEEGLAESMNLWEKTMEKDSDKLFSLALGKEEPALVSYFRNESYQGVNFRYQTFSKQDFGICYSIFDDYFILTTSFESIKKTIDLINLGKPENRIGQLFVIGFEGKSLTPQLEAFFKQYKPGGVLLLSKNIESAEQLEKLTGDLQNLSLKETGLPLFIAVDQEGGVISRIGFVQEKTPQSLLNEETQAYQVGLERAKELKSLGVNLNLAPLLDLTEQDDFLFNRSFQKNSEETGILAKSLISGQKAGGLLSTIKHFPGYGGINFNPEEELASLEKTPEYSQFKKATEASPEFVMTANVIYKEIDPLLPFSFSAKAIQLLRDNLGNQILVVSDDLGQNSLLENFSLKEIVTKPIEAGVDILIFSNYRLPAEGALDEFLTAYKDNVMSKEKINAAVSKIIQFKQINKDLLQ